MGASRNRRLPVTFRTETGRNVRHVRVFSDLRLLRIVIVAAAIPVALTRVLALAGVLHRYDISDAEGRTLPTIFNVVAWGADDYSLAITAVNAFCQLVVLIAVILWIVAARDLRARLGRDRPTFMVFILFALISVVDVTLAEEGYEKDGILRMTSTVTALRCAVDLFTLTFVIWLVWSYTNELLRAEGERSDSVAE